MQISPYTPVTLKRLRIPPCVRRGRNLSLAVAGSILAVTLTDTLASHICGRPPVPFLDPASPVFGGMSGGAPFWHRLTYHFLHASLPHAFLNAWSLVAAVFPSRIGPGRLIAAWLIAVSAPGFLFPEVPTVGLSALCYALLGSMLPGPGNRIPFFMWAIVSIASGFMFQSVNAPLHAYCFAAGSAFRFLFPSVKCKKF